MASVYFKCDCGKSLAAEAADAGRQVQCPDCGKSFPIPAPDSSWICSCGEEMSAPKTMGGASIRCAACREEHTVPIRLSLKHSRPPQRQPGAFAADVPRVPVGRANDVRCPKCGYLSPAVLALCPQCGRGLRKNTSVRRRCILAAEALVFVGLGWLLAANFTRLGVFIKSLLGPGLE